MRYLLFCVSLCASLFGVSSTYAQGKPQVDLLFAGDIDARFHSADRVEGEDGFAVGRLRLGARAKLGRFFTAVGQAEWAQEKPALLDGYVALRPTAYWEFSLGARKTPLFSSARDEVVFALPIPERSMLVRAFWPGRDVGFEVHRLPMPSLPIEVWLRVGNGSGIALGNDNSDFALDVRLDGVFGRAIPRSNPGRFFGFRMGAGLHWESAEDRLGIHGKSADGFSFYRPVPVYGPRYVGEMHALALLGPVSFRTEMALASESRAKDNDGNPNTPRVSQDPIQSSGGSAELAWMITGEQRAPGTWPAGLPGKTWGIGALEVALRGERLNLGTKAADVQKGGATTGAFAVRWWINSFCALSAAVYHTKYDTAPLEEPGVLRSTLGLIRATFQLNAVEAAPQ